MKNKKIEFFNPGQHPFVNQFYILEKLTLLQQSFALLILLYQD